MHASLELAPAPESAAAARVFVDRTLRQWGCRELIDDARVVVTELVSNVIHHAGTDSDIRIELDLDRHTIRMGVADHAGGRVVMRTSGPHADPGGRGLHLVDGLSARWGVDQFADRKLVWAEWRA